MPVPAGNPSGPLSSLALLLGGALGGAVLYRQTHRGFRRLLAAHRQQARRTDELQSRLKALDAKLEKLRREVAPATAAALGAAGAPTAADQQQRDRAVLLQQVQSVVNLAHLVPLRTVSPLMGGWAASADVLAELVYVLLSRRPRVVLECGSGVSTLWLAAAVKAYELPTRIVTLEHDAAFAEQTRRRLVSAGVEEIVELRTAPLTTSSFDGLDSLWYDPATLNGLSDIGLVFVDGPPETSGPLARRPAVPALLERLAPECTIVLDDASRPAETDIVDLWRAYLPDFGYRYLALEKGAAVFER